METFTSAFSLQVGAWLELGGILAAEATLLALLLSCQVAHAGSGARQCRVVPPRVTSGTCCRNSDRDKGLVVDEPCLGGRKGVLGIWYPGSGEGTGCRQGAWGRRHEGPEGWAGNTVTATADQSPLLSLGRGAAAWYLEAGPLCGWRAFVGLFVGGLRPGQDCGVSRGTGQGAARHSFPASALCLPRPAPAQPRSLEYKGA